MHGKVGFGKDEMLSYKQKHNSAVHIFATTLQDLNAFENSAILTAIKLTKFKLENTNESNKIFSTIETEVSKNGKEIVLKMQVISEDSKGNRKILYEKNAIKFIINEDETTIKTENVKSEKNVTNE